jgi:hypothetical protein
MTSCVIIGPNIIFAFVFRLFLILESAAWADSGFRSIYFRNISVIYKPTTYEVNDDGEYLLYTK